MSAGLLEPRAPYAGHFLHDTAHRTVIPLTRSKGDLFVLLGLLAAVNIAGAFWLDGWASTLLLLGAALVAVVGAQRREYSRTDLGLARADAGAGLRLGGSLAAVIAIGVTVAALFPVTRGFFEDKRFHQSHDGS